MTRRERSDIDARATWDWFWPVGIVVIGLAIVASAVWPWGFAA